MHTLVAEYCFNQSTYKLSEKFSQFVNSLNLPIFFFDKLTDGESDNMYNCQTILKRKKIVDGAHKKNSIFQNFKLSENVSQFVNLLE